MDYSPYPGVDPGTQFEPAEIDEQIHAAVAQAQEVVTALKQYLTGRE